LNQKIYSIHGIYYIHGSYILYACYSKSTESGNQQNSCVWSKITYGIFYKTITKYIYLESARRDLQNGVKIQVNFFCLFVDLMFRWSWSSLSRKINI